MVCIINYNNKKLWCVLLLTIINRCYGVYYYLLTIIIRSYGVYFYLLTLYGPNSFFRRFSGHSLR